MKFLTFLLCLLPCVLFAQDPAAAASTPPVLTPAPSWLMRMVGGFVSDHPWLAALTMLIGALRVPCKLISSALHNYVESTPTPEDDKLLDRVEHSLAFRVCAYLLDVVASIKLVRRDALGSTTKLFAPLFLAGGLACAVGCAGLSESQRAALVDAGKLAAKVALQLGLGELSQRVNELQPYAPRLGLLIETTFSEVRSQKSGVSEPEAIGAQIKAHVLATVPAALREEVLDAMRDALAKSATSTAAAPGRERQQDFNAALILALQSPETPDPIR